MADVNGLFRGDLVSVPADSGTEDVGGGGSGVVCTDRFQMIDRNFLTHTPDGMSRVRPSAGEPTEVQSPDKDNRGGGGLLSHDPRLPEMTLTRLAPSDVGGSVVFPLCHGLRDPSQTGPLVRPSDTTGPEDSVTGSRLRGFVTGSRLGVRGVLLRPSLPTDPTGGEEVWDGKRGPVDMERRTSSVGRTTVGPRCV